MQNHRCDPLRRVEGVGSAVGMWIMSIVVYENAKNEIRLMIVKEFEKFVPGGGYWPRGYRLQTSTVKSREEWVVCKALDVFFMCLSMDSESSFSHKLLQFSFLELLLMLKFLGISGWCGWKRWKSVKSRPAFLSHNQRPHLLKWCVSSLQH